MAITVTFVAAIAPLVGADPRDPQAIWYSYGSTTGDASGGTVTQNHDIPGLTADALIMQLGYGLSTSTTGFGNVAMLILGGAASIPDPALANAQRVGITALGIATVVSYLGRDLLVRSPLLRGAVGANVRTVFIWESNVNGGAHQSMCWGLIWSAQAMLLPGGPRIPEWAGI